MKSAIQRKQIVGILKEHEAGRKVAELAHEHGVSEATLYGLKSKYGGLEVGEAQRLKGLEEENRRLKHLVVDLSLDKEALKAIVRKTAWSLTADAAFAMKEFAMSERRACRLVKLDRSSYRYEPRANVELREELVKLARAKPRYGYRRLHVDK